MPNAARTAAHASRRRLLVPCAFFAIACGREELLHGLEESQANQVLLALDEVGVAATKQRDDGTDGAWRVEVSRSESGRARQVLSETELPRQRPPGFGEVFGKGSVAPTSVEERALYLHALSGELARSVEAIDGVVAARVHVALPPVDPIKLEPSPPSRAAVLVKARAGSRDRLESLAPGIQALVAGAVPGLQPSSVSVVVAEATSAPRVTAGSPARGRRTLLLALAGGAALLGVALPSVATASGRLALRRRFRRSA